MDGATVSEDSGKLRAAIHTFTIAQVGAALGVAVVGILFGAALSAGDGAAAQAGQYASAFVAGMLYNLGAALLVCVLLLMLAKAQRSAG